MSKERILFSILKSAWCIREEYALASGAFIKALFDGMMPAKTTDKITAGPAYINNNNSASNQNKQKQIALIPIKGTLMKDDVDDCWEFSAGMATMGKWIKEADNNPNIDAIVLHFDTPGGTVDGTQALGDLIKNTSKPIVGFADGQICSGGVWLGIHCDYLMAENTTTEIGSIGVMFAFGDMQPKWEKEGVKFHYIFADQSKDKNKTFLDAKNGDYKGIKEQSLNPLADIFINTVKANRPDINADVFTGKVYLAEAALKLGLIDEIGSLDRALQKAAELADEASKKNNIPKNSNSNLNNSSMKKYPFIANKANMENAETTADGAQLTHDQLKAVEEGLASTETLSASLKTAEDKATAAELAKVAAEKVSADQKVALDKQISDAAAELVTANAEIARLKGTAGAGSATLKSETEGGEGKEDLNDFCEKNSDNTASCVAKILDSRK